MRAVSRWRCRCIGEAHLTAEHIETKAKVTLEKVGDDCAITAVHLSVRAKIPGATEDVFRDSAGKAKAGCPVSKLHKADVTMYASLIA